MTRRLLIVAVAVAAVLLAVLTYVLRPTSEASGPIEAVPIDLEEQATEEMATGQEEITATAEPESATASPEASPEPDATEEADAAGTGQPSPTSEPSATLAPSPTLAAEPTLFEIQQEGSEVRFRIDEELRGAPFAVVGTTNQVAGQIAVNPTDLSTVQVGTIRVNARTFVTDNSNRNRAIQNAILQTDAYEFITFEPTSVVGLPATGTVGESYSFQITGNLTLRDTTREATWEATVTPSSDTELRGSANTTLNRSEWGLQIPSVPFVANVSEQVILEIDFVALATNPG